MIKVGQTYQSGGAGTVSHVVTVNAICGDEVYYKDSYGCYFHKPKRLFALLYISAQAYYDLKNG